MSKQKELGVLGGVIVALIIMGIFAFIADLCHVLPKWGQ